MKKNIMLVLVNQRKEHASTVQKMLTEWGCLIKTRLGLHSGVMDKCSDAGLLFLELEGEADKHEELKRKLNLLSGVDAKLVELETK